jgi:glucosamine kinase
MILIADSGSTKTDWRIVSPGGKISQLNTIGFNPYQYTPENLLETIRKELIGSVPSSIKEIHFYGAGCKSEASKSMLKDAFEILFPEANTQVQDDLTGAVRSLASNKKGFVAILGTGTNACIAENGDINIQLPSLGYILGDEGSGAFLGKELIRRYMLNRLPPELSLRMEKRFELNRDSIVENIYRKPFPNRYLAGFAKWIFQNKEDAVLSEIILQSFRSFFELYICPHPEHKSIPFHATGSVAYYFSAYLKTVAQEYGITVGTITESPIAGLTLYHLGESE